MMNTLSTLERSLATFDALSRAAWGLESKPVPARLPVNIYETDDALVLRALVPGVSTEQVELDLDDDVLTLRVTRERSAPEGFRPVWTERVEGEALRRFKLGVPVDVEAAEARLVDGVLTLRLPRLENAGPRRIPVTAS